MKRTLQLALISVFTLCLYSACTNRNYEKLHPVTPPAPGQVSDCDSAQSVVSYSLHIAPILQAKCISCHNSSFASGGYNLTTHAGVAVPAANGDLVSSVIWNGLASVMPQGQSQRIPVCEMGKIRNWVNSGFPNN